MSVATFSIRSGEREAEVTITPLGMLEGRESMLVNMFREQFGMKPLTEEEAASELKEVAVSDGKGKLFELATAAGTNGPQTVLTVMSHRSDASWFYKLAGDAALVEAQRPAFLEFLKSIQFKEAAAAAEAPTTTRADIGSAPRWKVPTSWQAGTPGDMQVARFSVPEVNGAKAEVFVSVFSNEAGGTLGNVNRWRRQLKLGEIDEGALSALVKPIAGTPGGLLAEMTNGDQQLLGAIVPRGGQFWFYKLFGGAEAVTPERENFVRFVQSTP
jgi:hypothetical protein